MANIERDQQLASLATNLKAFIDIFNDAFYAANDGANIYKSQGRNYPAKTIVLKHLLDDNLSQLKTLQTDETAK